MSECNTKEAQKLKDLGLCKGISATTFDSDDKKREADFAPLLVFLTIWVRLTDFFLPT